MKWEALDRHGMPDETITSMKEEFGPDVPPLCARAIEDAKLFGMENLLLEDTPGSGATTAAELAVVHAVRSYGQRAFLVSAAPEAWAKQLERRHSRIGLRVVSPCRAGEIAIEGEPRDWHVSVVTPEKLELIYAGDSYALKTAGLVIVDDAELFADPKRGRALEAVVAAAMVGTRPVRVIVIGRGVRDNKALTAWLHASVAVEERGATQVRIGVVQGGTSRYCEVPSGIRGIERFQTRSGKDESDVRVRLIAELALVPGRQVLAVRPDIKRAVAEAERVAARLPERCNTHVLAALDALPVTAASERLRMMLQRGVAVLHADLLPEHRTFVKDSFEQERLRVLVCPAGLAEMRELRATDVVVDPRKHVSHRGSHPTLEPMSRREIEALTRSAVCPPRRGGTADVARVLIVTDSLLEADRLTRRYVAAPCEPLAPWLLQGRLTEPVLLLIAAGCERRADIIAVLRATFSAHARPDLAERDALDARLDEVLALLRRAGCLSGPERRRLLVTELGRGALRHRIDVDSTEAIASWARGARASKVAPLEALLVAHGSNAGQSIYQSVHAEERRTTDYRAELSRRAVRARVSARPAVAAFVGSVSPPADADASRAKKVLALLDWLEGEDLAQIERCRSIAAGAAVRLASRTAWLLTAMADIAALSGWPSARSEQLLELARRLGERPQSAAVARGSDTERPPPTLRSARPANENFERSPAA